jgi:hypothetical protein
MNLHTDFSWGTLCRELPPHIKQAYDGMQIEARLGSCQT